MIYIPEVDHGKLTQMKLASTNDLMNTSIKTENAPIKMPKSKDFSIVYVTDFGM